MQNSECVTQKKNTFVLPLEGSSLTVSGDFDSGNLNNACLDLQTQEVQLTFGKDKDFKPSTKTWFHFYLEVDQPVDKLKLYFLKTNILSAAAKVVDLWRPVIRVEGFEWQRHTSPVEFELTGDGDVNFRMQLELPVRKKVFIAVGYPWSFSDNENYLWKLEQKIATRKDVYFNKEVLIYSPEKRPLHLLSISSADALRQEPGKYIEHLFPEQERESHFRDVRKPLVLITCRVHPGEIGSSHSLRGMLDFLLSEEKEAARLREEFYFMVVPMLNPDGVCNGNNRMDSYNQNLNRFYHLPDLTLQPSCYAVKSIVEEFRREIFAFFDLHGHANKKSCFLFGNSIGNPRLQTQSVLFAKYLSTICEWIQFKTCNFSKKHMSSRDKNQQMSKEGCARVVVHRWTNSPYCYTLETGLFKNVRVDDKGITRQGEHFYSPEIYMEVGEKMMIAFSRILSKGKELEDMRKFCTDYVAKLDKPVKKEKAKTQKAIKPTKGVKSESAQVEGEQRPLAAGKENARIRLGSQQLQVESHKQIGMALRRNKARLVNMNEDDDDE